MSNLKIGIYQFNPHTAWKRGGGEMHAQKYLDILLETGYDVSYLDTSKPEKYDVLHLFGANYQMSEVGKYAMQEGIKVVTTPILFPSQNTLKYQLMLKLERFFPFPTTLGLRRNFLHDCHAVIANSQPEKDYMVKAYGVSASKVEVLGTGVDKSFLEYQISAEDIPEDIKGFPPYFLMVGRVTPLKNQLAVAKQLIPLNQPLLLVGPADPYEQEYTQELDALAQQHPNLLKWVKGLSGNALKACYQRALAHILYSNTDVAPLVNIEAAALGTLVISKDHITVKAIMGENILYARHDNELRKCIAQVTNMSGDERMKRVAQQKKLVEEKYTWEQIVEDSLTLYKGLE